MFLNKHISTNKYINLYYNQINKHFHRALTLNSCKAFKNNENGSEFEKTHNFYDCHNDKNLDITFCREWSREIPQSLYQTMILLKSYCIKNHTCISDERFDNFIDNLTDNIKDATDHELKTIFSSLSKFKTNERKCARLRNYIEVWTALDDECFNRKSTMTISDKLIYISLFYKLGAVNDNGFCHICLSKFLKDAKNLEKYQFVQTVFYIGNLKDFHNKKNTHNIEAYLVEHFTEFQVDELAIIANTLHRIKIPIRCANLVNNIIDKIIETSNDISETSLLDLLKLINISIKHSNCDKIYHLSDCLKHQLPRLNIKCNIFLALALASARRIHESCLSNIADNAICTSNLSVIDLERLVRTFGTLNYVPSTKQCFFTKAIDELKMDTSKEKMYKNGRFYASCVAHLGLSNIYPKDLMKNVLDKEFLKNVYGKSCFSYAKDVLTIHNTAKIFYKDIIISNLLDSEVIILSKLNTKYLPDENKSTHSKMSKTFLDIKKTLQDNRGGAKYVICDHILTHYENGDIIICNNHKGVPQAIDKAFTEQSFGTIRYPPDGNIWIILIIGQNRTINHTSVIDKIPKPSGINITKKKELNKIGYHAAIICSDEFKKCRNTSEKIEYLTTIINNAIQYKKI